MNTPEFDLQIELTHIRSDIKALARLVRKLKNAQDDPTGEKAAARSRNSGFNKPLAVSDKLRKFLNLVDGECVSRSTVTKMVNAYIKEKIAMPDSGVTKSGKVITSIDEALMDLLAPPPDFMMTSLTINKLLSPHLLKLTPSEKTPEIEPDTEVEPKQKVMVKRPVVKKKTITA